MAKPWETIVQSNIKDHKIDPFSFLACVSNCIILLMALSTDYETPLF